MNVFLTLCSAVLSNLGDRAKKVSGAPIKTLRQKFSVTNIKIGKNAAKKIHTHKFVVKFWFFIGFRLIGGSLLGHHLERSPGKSPVRPYVKMALTL
jgi:hypothetical protein